jgi:hypothetical protein
MLNSRRFIIEGFWRGRTVHRSVHKSTERKLYEFARRKLHITFTDGTSLHMFVRECEPRERVRNVSNTYLNMIKDCMLYDVNSVEELNKARKGEGGDGDCSDGSVTVPMIGKPGIVHRIL